MKNILLTGAGPKSFIGRNLREQLSGKMNIYAPPHSELELLDYDALESYIIQHKIDAIVHAAIHIPMFNGTEQEYFNDMTMFLNIEKAGCLVDRVIYFGSGAEYDKRTDITMAQEDSVGNTIPVSEYGLAKYTMNKIARASSNIYNFRLFGVFGKYELWDIKFISNLCCKAVYGLPLTIRKDCLFDFLYIEDMPMVIEWALNATLSYHDYNLCHGVPYRLSELAGMVQDISGAKTEIVILNSGRDLDYTGDNTRLRNECPVFHPTPMKQAIKELYQYYQNNKSLISYDLLKNSR